MRISDRTLIYSPTDLANFLVCRHKTTLDLLAVQGHLQKPDWVDPLAEALRERGRQHEERYVIALHQQGVALCDLRGIDHKQALPRVVAAMHHGAGAIIQAPLEGDGWFGIADVLLRVEEASDLGSWSYEALDTKLSRVTRGSTILQLCVYTELIAGIQGRRPERFHVVTPAASEAYRFDDYSAFYRLAKAGLLAASAGAAATTYPEPVEHCELCAWWERCNRQRRGDDHLSFVAGLGRLHQAELESHDVTRLAALASVPVPLEFRPRRGSPESIVRLREQARVQLEARDSLLPVYELLPVRALDAQSASTAVTNVGLARLPEPSEGDVFLDLEGDPFAREGGREYLFGYGRASRGATFDYSSRWAFTDAEERAAFEAVVDDITASLARHPAAHVYHYAPYEPAAFKRLAGRYATRGEAVDTLLRGGRFIDLYGVVKNSLRAGVESYSIKQMEPFYGFRREVELGRAGDERRVVETALELGATEIKIVPATVREAVEGYNRDDCRSTLELRNWLEGLRARLIRSGTDVPRPTLADGAASEETTDRDQRFQALRTQLLRGIPEGLPRAPEEQAQWLLAYLVDYYRREERVVWAEYHRLREKSDDELLDEPEALAGLVFVERVFTPPAGGRRKTVVDRYRFPAQEIDIRGGDKLKLKDDTPFGEVDRCDKADGTIDVKKSVACTDVHPSAVVKLHIVTVLELEKSILRIAGAIAKGGFSKGGPEPLARALLLGEPPRLTSGPFRSAAGESVSDFAVRIAGDLDNSVLAIQGPPGSGKTYTGARMIRELVRQGRKVGVVATGHKVIRKLLDGVAGQAAEAGAPIRLAQKAGDDADPGPWSITLVDGNPEALDLLTSGRADVLGATAWLWSRPEFANSVDVLFVDEAGQMSLAGVLAVSQAARNLVLLGDPQQLEQPRKGSHPDGIDVSALEHLLGPHKTMPVDRGLFLPVTWRLAPAVCAFTSEVFYESKLAPKPGLERQRIQGPAGFRFAGAGLWMVDVVHEGCRNVSDEEAAVVASLVDELLGTGVEWVDEREAVRPLTAADILVVAPYNAHVRRIQEALAAGVESGTNRPLQPQVGTVDKFQGQEAPVVIYAMATSRPEDAPRGMEFLYSLNRLNVATSRAKAACIMVASPRLFEPDCRTPRQMALASALCRYREMARRQTAKPCDTVL